MVFYFAILWNIFKMFRITIYVFKYRGNWRNKIHFYLQVFILVTWFLYFFILWNKQHSESWVHYISTPKEILEWINRTKAYKSWSNGLLSFCILYPCIKQARYTFLIYKTYFDSLDGLYLYFIYREKIKWCVCVRMFAHWSWG